LLWEDQKTNPRILIRIPKTTASFVINEVFSTIGGDL
jgi:hypothetical protein